MGGGTLEFPDLGRHCSQDSCNQLDFLPFICDGCRKVFCLEHRSYVEHTCPKADHKSRVVVVCQVCSLMIEKKTAEQEDEKTLEEHVSSGNCDVTNKRIKPRCPVKTCKEILTFSKTYACKTCRQKVCFKHRFPTDHMCAATTAGESKFLLALASRSGGRDGANCRWESKKVASPQSSSIS